MNFETSRQTVLVRLPTSFIATLVDLHHSLDDELASILEEAVAIPSKAGVPSTEKHTGVPSAQCKGKYDAEFLGVSISEDTLPEVFGQIVDMLAEVAPEALETLARRRTRARRFVARAASQVHMHSTHLPVMQTMSGWWISKNIGRNQLKLALQTLCKVSGLRFGTDVRFPL